MTSTVVECGLDHCIDHGGSFPMLLLGGIVMWLVWRFAP